MLIPHHDGHGNRLGNLAEAVQHEIFYGPQQVLGSYVDPNKMGHWRDGDPEPHDILIVYAEDTPEFTSRFKELAQEVAEATNHRGVFCIKEGKNGVTDMVVDNPKFVPGAPAHPAALAQQAPLTPPAPPEPASPPAQTQP